MSHLQAGVVVVAQSITALAVLFYVVTHRP